MELAAGRERFSALVAETTVEGIESYVDKVDEIISQKGATFSSQLGELLDAYVLETVISSDMQSLGQTLLDKASMADQMIDEYFDGKLA